MRVCLFDDRAELLEPLSLTRPVFDLWCGLTTLGRKLCRYFGTKTPGVLIRPHLVEIYRQQHPDMPINDETWLRAEALALVNGRWLPPDEHFDLARIDGPCVALVDDEIAYVLAGPEQLQHVEIDNLEVTLESLKRSLPCREVGGRCIGFPWDLVENNSKELCRDFAGHLGQSWLPPHHNPLSLVGPLDRLRIEPTAVIEPMVVADTTGGPVVIDHRAVVTAFTRLEGPCYIGPFCQVLGAKIRAGTTIGPQCRIGGEVEASIIQGYSNKYHEGFLGHAYIGEWVNLGAGTHNSDLRNDYGPVKVTLLGQPISTGQSKVGCFVGDHTKTGLGTLLNTGTSVGAFCNLLPAGRLAPKYMPSFTNWWNGCISEGFPMETLLTTAQEVMQRRKCQLTEAHRALYGHLLNMSAPERRRLLREAEQRQLRRSA